MHIVRGMKKLILGCLLALPSFALADAPPKGPDFDAHAPNHGVDNSLAASDGDKAILPTDDVTFEHNSSIIDDVAASSLKNTSAWLKKHPKEKIVLEGHTSSSGTSAHNEDLATKRAAVVRSFLMREGIASDRIVMVIYGEVGSQKDVNPNDRRVIMFASLQPVQKIVTASLQSEHAISAAWTRDGSLIREMRADKVSRK